MQNQSTRAVSLDNDGLPDTLAEFEFQTWKEWNPYIVRFLDEEISRRTCDLASPEMITHVGLARYFKLLEKERQNMSGYFTRQDLLVLLDVNPYPWWTNTEHSLATSVYEHYGLDEQPNEDSIAYRLCVKLSKLTALQEIAFIDLLECAWRDHKIGPLAHAAKVVCSEPHIS